MVCPALLPILKTYKLPSSLVGCELRSKIRQFQHHCFNITLNLLLTKWFQLFPVLWYGIYFSTAFGLTPGGEYTFTYKQYIGAVVVRLFTERSRVPQYDTGSCKDRDSHRPGLPGFGPSLTDSLKNRISCGSYYASHFTFFVHFMILQPVKWYDGGQIKFFTPFHKIIS